MSAATPSSSPSVLHLDDARTWRGGQHQVCLLINELHQLGLRQALASPVGSPLRARLAMLPLDYFDFQTSLGELDPFIPGRLAGFVQAWGATHLHAHTGHAHTLGLRAARRARLPLIITRRVDFAVGGNWFSRRKYNAPGQHFIAISSAVRAALLAGGVPAEHITLVPSGVPPPDPASCLSRQQARDQFGIGPNELALVNVGALTDHKDQQTLVAAMPAVLRQLPQARLHILGEGELRPVLTKQIDALQLAQHVKLHGHVTDARLKLAGFDLFVSSSHLEGLGTAILDAMLAGLPVVATAAGGVVDIVAHGRTGWLTPPRAPAALAAALIDVLRIEPAQRDAITHAARAMVREHYSPAATARATLAVYQQSFAK